MPDEVELETAERHIREGNARIIAQHRIIARLSILGDDTELAERVLRNMHILQHARVDQRDRLVTMMSRGGGGVVSLTRP